MPSAVDVEYSLGAKVLPWAGALVLLVGIGYFVGVGIERGWFKPWMQFAGAVALSAAFIVMGLIKREEREDFGKLLMGIGSCGMYLSFAGSHVFNNLYSGEVMIALFLGWSLVNLAYSNGTSSQVFSTIGFLGGLSAALMPLQEQKVALNFILHFAIVIPALLIAAKNRWSLFIAGIWILATAALIPGLWSDVDWATRVAVLDANALLACVAYAIGFDRTDFDPIAYFPPSALVISAIGGLAIRNDSLGALHFLIFGLSGLACAALVRGTEVAKSICIGSMVVILCFAPLGFRGVTPSAIFAVLAAVCAGISLRSLPKAAVAFAWTELALAFAGYTFVWSGEQTDWGTESMLLLLMAGSTVWVAWCTNKVQQASENLFIVASLLLLPMLSRVAWLSGPAGPLRLNEYTSLMILWIGFSGALFAVGGRRWASVAIIAWGVLILGLLVYAAPFQAAQPGRILETSLLAVFAAAVIHACLASSSHASESGKQALIGLTGFIVGCLAARAGFIGVRHPSIGMTPFASTSLALAVVSLAASIVLAKTRWGAAILLCWAFFAASLFMLVMAAQVSQTKLGEEYLVLAMLLVGALFSGHTTWADVPGNLGQTYLGMVGVLVGGLLTRLGYLALSRSWMAVESDSAFALSASAVSILMSAVLGFTRWRSMAYVAWGFCCASAWIYASNFAERGTPIANEQAVLGSLIAATTLAGWFSARIASSREGPGSVAIFLNWWYLSRLGIVVLCGEPVGMETDWAMTVTWIAFGAALLVLGFAIDQRYVRFWSFGVFGLTLAKVFLIDLAKDIDPLARVAILMAFGLAMLAGGYWYIRMRNKQEKSVGPPPERPA